MIDADSSERDQRVRRPVSLVLCATLFCGCLGQIEDGAGAGSLGSFEPSGSGTEGSPGPRAGAGDLSGTPTGGQPSGSAGPSPAGGTTSQAGPSGSGVGGVESMPSPETPGGEPGPGGNGGCGCPAGSGYVELERAGEVSFLDQAPGFGVPKPGGECLPEGPVAARETCGDLWTVIACNQDGCLFIQPPRGAGSTQLFWLSSSQDSVLQIDSGQVGFDKVGSMVEGKFDFTSDGSDGTTRGTFSVCDVSAPACN